MVDRTTYSDADHTPDLPLRQIFGRQRLPSDLCKTVADANLLTVETFSMLGDTIAAVKTTLKAIIPDEDKLGPDPPARELALAALAAVWKTCSTMQDHFAARRAKMEEDPSKVPEIPGEDHAEFRQQFIARHPDVVLPHHREPHRKFVERLQRDFLVHGAVNFYEVGEMRTRNEQIAQKSGLSRNAEDLLRVVQIDQPQAANFSIENPLLSLLWSTPSMVALQRVARTLDLDFDQCAFGAPSLKPTRLRVFCEALADVCMTCPAGDHVHERLQGKVWNPKRRKVVFRTKLAQEYPHARCATIALGVQQLWQDDLVQFQQSFQLKTPAADRKRPLGLPSR